jgi:hypothetical protein
MTAPRATTRARRSTGAAGTIPPAVAAWFAGQAVPTPWEALLPDTEANVSAWWRAWLAAHPGAAQPANAPWIQWGSA